MENFWVASMAKVRGFFETSIQRIKSAAFVYNRLQRIKKVKDSVALLNTSKEEEDLFSALKALSKVKLIELEMEKEVQMAIMSAFEKFGNQLILLLTKAVNEKTIEIHGIFQRTIKEVFKTNLESMLAYITAAKKLTDLSPFCLSSVFHAIKIMVYNLLDASLQKDASQLFKQVISLDFFSKVTGSSSKVACSLLDLLVKNCMSLDSYSDTEDKVSLITFIKAIDSMPIKPPEVFFNKLLDLFAKTKQHARSSELILEVMISNKIKASLVTFNTLLEVYISQRNMKMAWYLFDSLVKNADPRPDSYTFCTMMSGLRACSPINVAQIERLFNMHAGENKPDLVVVNCLLDVYMITDNETKALEFLDHVSSQYQILPDEATYNTLIKGCAKSKSLAKAEGHFQAMKEACLKPNTVTYNSLMDICVKSRKLTKALTYLREMTSHGCQPDHFSYSIIFTGMKACASEAIYQQCVTHLLTLLPSPSFRVDEVFFNAIMDVACRFKDTANVELMLVHMKNRGILPSSVTYGVLIKTFGRSKQVDKVKQIFHEMVHERKILPNDVFFGSLIEAFICCESLKDAEAAFKSLHTYKVKVNAVILATMIKGYTRECYYDAAINLFETFRHDENCTLNTICYNAALDASVKSKNLRLANEYFDEMYDQGINPDLITYSIAIKGHCYAKQASVAVDFLKQMIEENLTPDLPIFNNVLETCANFKDHGLAIYVYNQMLTLRQSPNLITYGIMVKVYGFSKELQKAFDLLPTMIQQGIQPSIIFFTNLIHISIANKKPHLALKALDLLDQHGVKPDQFCADKLIAGLQKVAKDPNMLAHARYKLSSYGLQVGSAPDVSKQRKPLAFSDVDAENFNMTNTTSKLDSIPTNVFSKHPHSAKEPLGKNQPAFNHQEPPGQPGNRPRQFGVDCQNIIKMAKQPTSTGGARSKAIR